MSWLSSLLHKEAGRRKFQPGDRIRFLTSPRKGTGRGIVLMPDFGRGEVVSYNHERRTYYIKDLGNGENAPNIIEIHTRNVLPENVQQQ